MYGWVAEKVTKGSLLSADNSKSLKTVRPISSTYIAEVTLAEDMAEKNRKSKENSNDELDLALSGKSHHILLTLMYSMTLAAIAF